MTSVSFASALAVGSNAWHLSGWGLSAGDVIAITGAGRGIITWLTSNSQDNALLEFLKVAEKELRLRKGILDPIELNKQWSRTVTLLQNGQRQDHYLDGLAQNKLENVCRYTWMMILIVAALDVSVSSTTLTKIIVELSAKLFIDAVLDVEYLQHEIPQHISGWRSAGAVRNITSNARTAWNKLENRPHHHLPGFVPDIDVDEVVRFLHWLVIGPEDAFTTASSDVHSLAAVLAGLGFDSLHTAVKSEDAGIELQEGHCILLFDAEWISEDIEQARKAKEGRKGMRIPLADGTNMHEVVSLWPTAENTHNDLRLVFDRGQAAGSDLDVRAGRGAYGVRDLDIVLRFYSTTDIQTRRLSTQVTDLAQRLLFSSSAVSYHALDDLLARWPDEAVSYAVQYMTALQPVARSIIRGRDIPLPHSFDLASAATQLGKKYLQQLRAFLLGYYYGAFRGIVDVSQLRMREGFGCWSWNDTSFFLRIFELVRSKMVTEEEDGQFWRHQIMKMIGFLFAGAEFGQLTSIGHGAVGLLAKLSVVTPGLLGAADTPTKLKMFHLLDTDQSSFPADQHGIIQPAEQARPEVREVTGPALRDDETLIVQTSDPDFTAHIEPAWGINTTLCLVAYRYRGRLVYKVNPLDAEAAVLEWWAGNESGMHIQKTHDDSGDLGRESDRRADDAEVHNHQDVSVTYTVQPSDFQGGLVSMIKAIPTRTQEQHAVQFVVLTTTKKPRARTCIAAMYSQYHFERRSVCLNFEEGTGTFTDAMVIQFSKTVLVVIP